MSSKPDLPTSSDLLDRPARLLLNAISHSGPKAVEAFRAWRSAVSLDDADYASHRVLPMLADLIRKEGIDDPDEGRMRGVGRHIWVNNLLKLRLLFAALDVLEGAGIRPVLLKGAALFAQSAGTEGKRASADYDILVLPGVLKRAGEALRRHGFNPEGHSWDDLNDGLTGSVSAGMAIALEGHIGSVDLHWRPLWNIHDRALAELFVAAAEERAMRGHAVYVPSVTHHLFTAMARCEPWDRSECFTRLAEGRLLLSGHREPVDWNEFATLVERYGLHAPALAYFDALAQDADLYAPVAFLDRVAAGFSSAQRREWRIRAKPPERRTPLQQWHLGRQDVAFHRTDLAVPLPGLLEAWLRSLGGEWPISGLIWRMARRRFSGEATSSPRFLEGFSYPEAAGRWTLGKWALLTVPLSEAQRKGEVARLHAHLFRGKARRTRIIATGGRGLFQRRLKGTEDDPDLALRMVPLPELGGDGLLLLWLPDAGSPRAAGQSGDRRELGLFVRKDWQNGSRGGHRRGIPVFFFLGKAWHRIFIRRPRRPRIPRPVGEHAPSGSRGETATPKSRG